MNQPWSSLTVPPNAIIVAQNGSPSALAEPTTRPDNRSNPGFGPRKAVGLWLIDRKMWLIGRNTNYRERMSKGVIDERVLYRVSPDEETLVWTNFDPDDDGHVVWESNCRHVSPAPASGPYFWRSYS